MQFVKNGRLLRVMAYRGWDKGKKRSTVKMVGSLNPYTYETSPGLIESLNAEEKEELQSKIQELRELNAAGSARYLMSSVVQQLAQADALLVAGMAFDVSRLTSEQASAVWRSMKALEAMLTSGGHPRQKRARRKPTPASTDVRQADLIAPEA